MVHKDRIPAIREANSPELYCLKKSAGRESSRIMAAASTASSIFVLIRAINKDCMARISSWLVETQTINTAIASNTRKFPLSSTSEKISWVSLGDNIPMRVTASKAMAYSTMSDRDRDLII